ncbi:MAG: hypothetical protein HQK60_00160 [Deltaproteobacteria bacterium]|nr:hypothetical protein [Deltaproteobacteria bacterium]
MRPSVVHCDQARPRLLPVLPPPYALVFSDRSGEIAGSSPILGRCLP